MRLCWLTDIHLNFIGRTDQEQFFAEVLAEGADAVVLTGDIGEANNVGLYLSRLDEALQLPIYSCLGNHDFYGGSIAAVREKMRVLSRERPRLKYLTTLTEPISLTADCALVGHDGWADARVGDYEHSEVLLNDYRLIAELRHLSKSARVPVLRQLGDEAAEHLRRVLPAALATHRRAVVATHVPPLRVACWHQGRTSDDEWAPHFVCQAVGDALLEIAAAFPANELTVLCGHTHSSGVCQPLPNLTIHTGEATYGLPLVQRVWEVA